VFPGASLRDSCGTGLSSIRRCVKSGNDGVPGATARYNAPTQGLGLENQAMLLRYQGDSVRVAGNWQTAGTLRSGASQFASKRAGFQQSFSRREYSEVYEGGLGCCAPGPQSANVLIPELAEGGNAGRLFWGRRWCWPAV